MSTTEHDLPSGTDRDVDDDAGDETGDETGDEAGDETGDGSGGLLSPPSADEAATSPGPVAIPPIIMATEEDAAGPTGETPDGAPVNGVDLPVAPHDYDTADYPPVSDDILDELRRADIDGPIVAPAPQDEATSRRRRPKRTADFEQEPIPVPLRVPRLLGRKPRVRKVTRVVRHVDPWSVFKIAIVANLVLYVIVLVAGVLLWNVAYATGTIENVERFFESFGWAEFEFVGGEIYHAAWIAGLFVAIGLTGLSVLLATLFNLITDLVGGVRLTVLEEEVVEKRTSPMRRFVVRRPEPTVPAVTRDESGTITREAVVDETGHVTP